MPSKRGLTFSFDVESKVFQTGMKIKYQVSKNGNKIVILPCSNEESNTISRKKVGTKIKSLVDIRSKAVVEAVSTSSSIEVYIYDDRIIVKLINVNGNERLLEVDRELIKSIESIIVLGSVDMNDALKMISLFSGAGLMDLGFHKVGGLDGSNKFNSFRTELAVDYNKAAISTYNHNLRPVGKVMSVYDLDMKKLPAASILIGGPSCRPYSSERCDRTKIEAAEHSDYGNLDAFLEAAISKKYDCVLLENVSGFMAKNGYYLNKTLEVLRGYYSDIDYGVINSKNVGGAQDRKRFFLLASRLGPISLPTDLKIPPITVQEALGQITPNWPNYYDVVKSGESVKNRMKFIPYGGNFRDVPKELFKQLKNRHSNSYRRLDPHGLSPTLCHVRKCTMISPYNDRILSVAECSRLMGVEVRDHFEFLGTLDEKYQQVCNAVHVQVASEIAKKLYSVISEVYKKPVFRTIST